MLGYIAVTYLVIINVFTFIVRGVDKRKSVKKRRRISEKELLIFCALGGFVGAVIGMSVWHHKTIKSSFLWKFWLIVFGWIVGMCLICYFLYL